VSSNSHDTAAASSTAAGDAKAKVHRARATGAAVRTEVTTKPSMSQQHSAPAAASKLPPLRFRKSPSTNSAASTD
jgi:hypothetical protein